MSAVGFRSRVDSLFGAIERRPGRAIATVGVVFAVAYAGAFLSGVSQAPAVRGDAVQYYAYLRSIVFDRDLDFTNEYERFYASPDGARTNVWLTERTDAGRPPNMMSIGPAILWSPPFVVVAGIGALLSVIGLGESPDGFSLAAQLSAGLAGVGYAALGAWLSFLITARWFGSRAAFWAATVAWLGGPALYYSLISPTYSHATSLFAVSLFILIWLRTSGRRDWARALGLGALGGLAALVRWQDAIVLGLPCWELLTARLAGRETSRRALVFLLAMGAGTLIVVSPQLVAWQAVYGHAFVVPQGGAFMRWTEPEILAVLFSTRRGLFTWSPALLVAVVGLWWAWRHERTMTAGLALMLATAIYVNAAVSDWWAGEAFGARRFVSYGPVFALGLAALAARLEKTGHLMTLRALAIGLVAYNLLFLLQYQVAMRGRTDLVPYPETVRQILIDRLFVPWRLISHWLNG